MGWVDIVFPHHKPLPSPPAPVPIPSPVPPPDENATSAAKVFFELTNELRKKHNLEPLLDSSLLDKSSEYWVSIMVKYQRLSHFIDGYPAPADRMHSAGYSWASNTGENIAMTSSSDPKRAFDLLVSDPPHRANILGAYTSMGFGHGRDAYGRWYWCTDFGNARTNMFTSASRAPCNMPGGVYDPLVVRSP